MSDTQLIKDKIDIVDFINEYVQLKPAGVNHKGLCPFHNEKSPSFMANRERQSWHCFGCNKGGDIFTFLEEIEGMEFIEALRMLADRAGVPLTFSGGSKEQSSQKTRIKDINTEAARFFHNFLLKMDAAKPALSYLHDRGFNDETIEHWQIGFIPDQWDLLTQYLLKKGHSIDDLVGSGLTIQREGSDKASGRGFYDRFRGRIMFPIWDVHGGVVGFTGRILVETEKSGGKYVNTPQTIVFDKSRVVFGLNKAKTEIKSKDLIVMVEGQTDVISSHQAGMANVVATSGTALTELQIKLLKRYSSNVSIAFDADAAGQKAAKRGIDLALQEGMNIKVIQIPDGKGDDPHECLQQNPDVWFAAVQDAKNIMNWYIDKAFVGKNLSDPKNKQQIVDEVLPEIARIPYAVEKDHWLRELASKLTVDVAVLREDLERVKKEVKKAHPQKKEEPKQESVAAKKRTRMDLLLERLFALMLRFKLSGNEYQLPESALSTSEFHALYEIMKKSYTDGSFDIDALREAVSSHNSENLIDVLLMKGDLEYRSFDEPKAKAEAEAIAGQIKKEWSKARRQELQHLIAEAEKAGESDTLTKLLQEFQNVSDS